MRQQPLKYSLLSYIPEKENPFEWGSFKKIIFLELYTPFKATAVRMQMLNKRQEVNFIEGKRTNDIWVAGARFYLISIYTERF